MEEVGRRGKGKEEGDLDGREVERGRRKVEEGGKR